MKPSSILITAIIALLILMSCKQDSPSETQNSAPKIESISANPSTIKVNEETTLSCIATDQDGDDLTISWTSENGTFPNGNRGESVKWEAPEIADTYRVTATVSDGKDTDKENLDLAVQEAPQENQPPANPSSPNPSDNAIDISTTTTISWSCSDPDGDTLSYDVYFGTDSTPNNTELVSQNQSGTSYNPGTLSENKTYYWKIVAKDGQATTEGSVWSFTTESGTIMGVPCPGIPTVTYAGKTYNTVQIGDQCWFKENLNIGTKINNTTGGYLQTDNNLIEKYCYDNDEDNCAKYGGLYEWPEAMQYVTTEGAQGICPEGWHIPTYTELQTLKNAVGGDGNALKAIGQGSGSDGAGTNTSGFSALLAGYRHYYGYFDYLGENTFFWSSTENGSNAHQMFLYTNISYVYFHNYYKTIGFSVRCLKD